MSHSITITCDSKGCPSAHVDHRATAVGGARANAPEGWGTSKVRTNGRLKTVDLCVKHNGERPADLGPYEPPTFEEV